MSMLRRSPKNEASVFFASIYHFLKKKSNSFVVTFDTFKAEVEAKEWQYFNVIFLYIGGIEWSFFKSDSQRFFRVTMLPPGSRPFSVSWMRTWERQAIVPWTWDVNYFHMFVLEPRWLGSWFITIYVEIHMFLKKTRMYLWHKRP